MTLGTMKRTVFAANAANHRSLTTQQRDRLRHNGQIPPPSAGKDPLCVFVLFLNLLPSF